MLMAASTCLVFLALLLLLLGQFGALLLVQVLGMPIPLECVALVVAGAGVAAGFARSVINAAY